METYQIIVLILACIAVIFGSIYLWRVRRNKIKDDEEMDEETKARKLKKSSLKRILIALLLIIAGIIVTYLLFALIYGLIKF